MRVAINGCGIAGPALAYWLERGGHEAVIYEQAPALRRGGYVIDFWGHGYDLAEKMGLLPGLRHDGFLVEHLIGRNAKGRTVTDLDGTIFSTLTKGRYLSLQRADLAARLHGALGQTPVQFGTSVTGYEEQGDKVEVTLSDGSQQSFDLLIGADGLHSAIRKLGWGTGHIRQTGLTVGAFMAQGYRPREELAYVQFTEPGRQISRVALAGDETLFLAVADARFAKGHPHGLADDKAAIEAMLDGMGGEVPAILDALQTSADVYLDPVAQVAVTPWFKGRVALVGDAGGCPSLLAGEGSALAMLSGYVLAGELTEKPLPEALAAWQARMAPHVATKQKAAISFSGFFAPRTALALWGRDMALRLSSWPIFARYFVAGMLKTPWPLPEYSAFR